MAIQQFHAHVCETLQGILRAALEQAGLLLFMVDAVFV
jgi:hypothetical protein